MARIRTIKPEFWTDEKIVELTFPARLLFVGLWNFADDDGRMIYSPKRVRMQVFPSPSDAVGIEELVQELVALRLVAIYGVDGVDYLQIRNFDRHQKIDKRSKSKFPPPPSDSSPNSGGHPARVVELRPIPPSPAEDPTIPTTEGKGKEGIKEEETDQGKGGDLLPSNPDEIPEGLDPFQYATAILEKLSLPSSRSLLGIVASSVQTLAKSDRISHAAATARILSRAQSAIDAGKKVNRFWFEDGGFNSDDPTRSSSKGGRRSNTDREAVDRFTNNKRAGRVKGDVGVQF